VANFALQLFLKQKKEKQNKEEVHIDQPESAALILLSLMQP
jgi:hypothetical protein